MWSGHQDFYFLKDFRCLQKLALWPKFLLNGDVWLLVLLKVGHRSRKWAVTQFDQFNHVYAMMENTVPPLSNTYVNPMIIVTFQVLTIPIVYCLNTNKHWNIPSPIHLFSNKPNNLNSGRFDTFCHWNVRCQNFLSPKNPNQNFWTCEASPNIIHQIWI